MYYEYFLSGCNLLFLYLIRSIQGIFFFFLNFDNTMDEKKTHTNMTNSQEAIMADPANSETVKTTQNCLNLKISNLNQVMAGSHIPDL